MKILLLGEYSALHKNLKEGIIELGHDAVIAAHGDGWKNIERDIDLKPKWPYVFGRLEYRLKLLSLLSVVRNYDIVQLINPFAFYLNFFPKIFFIDQIIRQNDKVFILGAGEDSFFWRYGRSKLDYGPFDDFLRYDLKKEHYYIDSEKSFNFNLKLIKKIRGIIPVMYEFEISYKNIDNLLPTIPLPINTRKIKYTPNNYNRKIFIFHGLNRYGFKGTRHIEKAFRILSEKYPNDLDLSIEGNMSLDKYIDVMKKANIVIDQVNSYSCGINALYALAMGKIVMGGAEPESLASLGVNQSPVINLRPDAEDIVCKIEQLLDQRGDFERLGYESRIFVEKVHDHIEIAQRYIDTWLAN